MVNSEDALTPERTSWDRSDSLVQRWSEYPEATLRLCFADIHRRLAVQDFMWSPAGVPRKATSFGFCTYLGCWDVARSAPLTGFEDTAEGYGDMQVRPDWRSARQDPDDPQLLWVPGSVESALAPRSVLATQVAKLRRLGLSSSVGVENEFTLVASDPSGGAFQPVSEVNGDYALGRTTKLHRVLRDVAARSRRAGLAVDNYRCECHPSQCEIVLHHDDPMVACDDALLLQHLVRRTAEDHGCRAAYVAAPAPGEGNSCHIHMSLTPLEGNSDSDNGVFRSFVAGIVHVLPALGPVIAPTSNGWTRLRSAPFAPSTSSWGNDDRTAAVRVIGSGTSSQRCEIRIGGADCQPHLLVAVLLACGRYGIETNMELVGNSGRGLSLPRTPHDALSLWYGSEELAELLGEEVIDLLGTALRSDIDNRLDVVTSYDYQWDAERS